MFATSKEAKKAGWFSRHYQTSAAHNEARQKCEVKRAAKLRNAQERNEEAASRSPSEQLGRLDRRIGVGIGAKKERACLEARIG